MKNIRSIALLVGLLFSSFSFASMTDAMAAIKAGDYATAATLLEAEVANEDAEAHYQMGLLLADGKGVTADMEAAVAQMQLAAMQEHEDAITWLTERGIEPEGNPEDDC